MSIDFHLEFGYTTQAMVDIRDDGQGMGSQERDEIGSRKLQDSSTLATLTSLTVRLDLGHGTKIYYKSHGIKVETWKSGKRIFAQTEESLGDTKSRQGAILRLDESEDPTGKGTKIRLADFAKQSEFKSLDELAEYVRWYTILAFGQYFGQAQSMSLDLKPADGFSSVTIPFGFKFPTEQLDLSTGTENSCKIFGPETLECGTTENGDSVDVQIVGALLGEAHRDIVPHTYSHMGIWLAKDFIRIERRKFWKMCLAGNIITVPCC